MEQQPGDAGLAQDLTQALTAEIRHLIQAKEALESMAEERRGLQKRCQECKARILAMMTQGNIDKANFEEYAVSVATSNRKESITAKSLPDILKRCLPDKDAEELCPKILGTLTSSSQPFIRMSKSKSRS